MGEELFDEFDIPALGEGPLATCRTLVVRGGYCRTEVYVGIARNAEFQPETIIAVDGEELRRALNSMTIGRPEILTRRRKTKRRAAPKRRRRSK